MKTKLLTGLIALSCLTVSCTQKRPLQTVNKKDDTSASLLCGREDEFLYVPSTIETSRTATGSRPHFMGQERIVKLKCTETSLDVVDVDEDSRFTGNPTNLKPVLSIPLTHVAYKCAEDLDHKCTNREEEDNDLPWQKRPYVRLKAEEMRIEETSWLPEEVANLFYPCFKPMRETLIKKDVSAEAINILFERSYKTDIKCAGDLESPKDLDFRVRYHYSIVKLDRLTTPDFKPLALNRQDGIPFGFFTTQTMKLDVDNNAMADGKKEFINRWNPKKVIPYYLTEGFQLPQNKSLIKATEVAIGSINESLKRAGAQMRIELKGFIGTDQSGDLRYNSIVLENDPFGVGVIGYGPSAANPRTGEIVHGRIVMYLGTMLKYIKRTYDELVQKKKVQKVPGSKFASSQFVSSQLVSPHSAGSHSAGSQSAGRTGGEPFTARLSLNAKTIHDQVLNPLRHQLSRDDFKKNPLQLLLLKNCFYTPEMMDFVGTLETEIDKLIADLGLKTWNQLEDQEQQKVLDVLTPFVWTPTLVHELGHNLGLRHNFGGSEDKANFFTKTELESMGVHHEITASSVMDYSSTALNELPVMGKYDIAALRYGYAERLELKDGSLIDVAALKNGGTDLKPYKFCTDEHSAVNPNCNVFDEGSTLTEMTQFNIKKYEHDYALSNFRGGRANFTLMGDIAQLERLKHTFGSLRRVFERYEVVKNTFGLSDLGEEWEKYPELKDLKSATRLAADFLTQVILTPDLSCAIAMSEKPTEIVALIPIQKISPFAADCFDAENVQVPPQYAIVGQAGKLFQSRIDPRAQHEDPRQIDVRGIWLDKILALDTLVGRRSDIGPFNIFLDNFLDITDVSNGLTDVLKAAILNEVVAPVEIKTVAGQILKVEAPIPLFDEAEQQNGHRLIDHPVEELTKALGLPLGNPSFQTVLIQRLKAQLPSPSQKVEPTSLLNALKVQTLMPGQSTTGPSTLIGTEIITTSPTSDVASMAVFAHKATRLLESLGQEKVQAIVEELGAQGPKAAPIENLSAAEKEARALDLDVLKRFLEGGFQPSSFYAMLIQAMK